MTFSHGGHFNVKELTALLLMHMNFVISLKVFIVIRSNVVKY